MGRPSSITSPSRLRPPLAVRGAIEPRPGCEWLMRCWEWRMERRPDRSLWRLLAARCNGRIAVEKLGGVAAAEVLLMAWQGRRRGNCFLSTPVRFGRGGDKAINRTGKP